MVDPVTLTATLAGGLAKFAWDTIKEAPQEGLKGLVAGQAERITVAVLGEDRTRLAEDHVREFRRRLSGPRKLAQNHDIAKALRTAELEAIDHVILKFEESAGPNPPVQLLKEVRRRLYAAKAEAGRMTWDDNQQRAMLASFERSFTGSGAQLEGNLDGAARQATEIAWTELLSWSNSPAPDRLRSRFFGDHDGPTSWFEAYCGYVAEELKQPASRMREAFFAGKLVEIGGVVIEGSLVLKRIESGTGALQHELKAARRQLSGLEERGAQIVAELNRRVTSGPFRSMELVLDQDEARLAASIFPRKDDYRNDRVHVPAVVEQVESALENQRSALIVGHGASGKTTLAKLLACRPHYRNRRVYYLDLTGSSPEFPLGDGAVEAMAMIADRDVLFVIDNAHLNPTAAFDVWHQWLTSGRGSRLLVLTRRVRPDRDVWDASPEVEAMDLMRFELVVQPEDLQGVYRRLTQCIAGPSPLEPALLDRWLKLFGGDLMMFGVAVLGCIARGGDAETLRPEDAHTYVRSAYFEKLPDEKAALLDLAALAEIEGPAPVEAFERNAFRASIQRGLVWVDARGRGGRFKNYRLCHPGLGALFRDTAGVVATSGRDRIRLVQAQPSAAAVLAARLHRTGAVDEARALLQDVWRKSPWPWPTAELGLNWLKTVLRLTQVLTVLSDEELAGRAAAWAALPNTQDELIKEGLTMPLGNLKTFLNYAGGAMPEVANVIQEGLVANPAKLTAQVLSTPPHFIASFLRYAHREMPEVADIVRDCLATRSDEFTVQALKSSLGNLKAFLTYADAAMPEVAYAIQEILVANPEGLAAQALATPLQPLTAFLAYAEKAMPKVAEIIRDALLANSGDLADRGLAAPLELAIFLAYAEEAMPEVAGIIRNALVANSGGLADRVLSAPLEHLAPFLARADEVMPEVSDVIRDALVANSEHLADRALTAPLEHLAVFLTLVATELPEVANAIKGRFAAHPDRLVAQALATPLEHLGSFLACAEAKMPEVATALLKTLTVEPGLGRWAARFVLDGPEKIVGLAQWPEAVVQGLGVIDGRAWQAAWGETEHPQPSWFEQYARLCYRADRADLLGVTAGAIIRSARPADFGPRAMNIKHLAAILVAPHDCAPAEVDALFARSVAHDWVPAQYRSLAGPGALCSALRNVALDERIYLHRYFRHPELRKRVMVGHPKERASAAEVSIWLQLFAAANLLEDTGPLSSPMNPALVCSALNEWPPGPPNEGARPIQIALWAGFREWCRLSGEELKLDRALGEGILAQFRSAQPIGRPRWVALNRVMIDWLERCEENDWWVVAERTTLLQALRAELGGN